MSLALLRTSGTKNIWSSNFGGSFTSVTKTTISPMIVNRLNSVALAEENFVLPQNQNLHLTHVFQQDSQEGTRKPYTSNFPLTTKGQNDAALKRFHPRRAMK